jgi:putative DNA primase/helicase
MNMDTLIEERAVVQLFSPKSPAGDLDADACSAKAPFEIAPSTARKVASDLPRVIRVMGGTLHEEATQGELAILESNIAIYERGMKLVRAISREEQASGARRTLVAQFVEIDHAGMRDLLCQAASFVRFNAKTEKWLPINAPKDVASTILSRAGGWKCPSVAGLITTPTLRPDGTLLNKPGFDADTRLVLLDSLAMPEIPDQATKQEAIEALSLLDELVAEFPFIDDVSRAVALSALITPVARGAFRVAPMHVVRAPAPGSGKSFLLDVSSTILTGQPCPVMSAGAKEEETEKRIGAALLAGQPIISIDNLNGDLGGDALCQAIERPLVDIRVLGKSELVRIESRACFFATGNNLKLTGDITRRAVICTLDAKVECPESREFRSNPVTMVLENRGRYVAAILVILRAYIVAGKPSPAGPFGSFQEWSDLVRSALMWLGCSDPVQSNQVARREDPKIQALNSALVCCAGLVGCGRDAKFTAKSLVTQAGTERGELFEALSFVALNKVGQLDSKSLGKYLARVEGQIVGGLKFCKVIDSGGHAANWWVERCGSSGSSG